MKAALINPDGEKKSMELPAQFTEELNPDLIKRAVLFEQSIARQPYGTYERAGKGYAVTVYKRRRHYRGSYGIGISRAPRKVISRRGSRFNWVGAFAPGTVGGRRAHPPKTEKVWAKKINRKEYMKALRSAVSATTKKAVVSGRGHAVPQEYPFVISKSEGIGKTRNMMGFLKKLGLGNELQRASKTKLRAGKGKMRGRKTKKKKGPLVVVSGPCPLMKAARNIPGIDVVEVNNLSAALLAPGTAAGRLTIFTEEAVSKMKKEALFE